MSEGVAEQKKALRERIANLKSSMPEHMAAEHSRKISSEILHLPEFGAAKTVFCYLPLSGEVDSFPIVRRCLELGKRVVVPKALVKERDILACEIQALDGLAPGAFGILEPADAKPLPADQIDLAVVPGLAFDEHGQRLGHGYGFFDNFLRSVRKDALAVGVAFECQIHRVPRDDSDVPVDVVVTESRVIRARLPGARRPGRRSLVP